MLNRLSFAFALACFFSLTAYAQDAPADSTASVAADSVSVPWYYTWQREGVYLSGPQNYVFRFNDPTGEGIGYEVHTFVLKHRRDVYVRYQGECFYAPDGWMPQRTTCHTFIAIDASWRRSKAAFLEGLRRL